MPAMSVVEAVAVAEGGPCRGRKASQREAAKRAKEPFFAERLTIAGALRTADGFRPKDFQEIEPVPNG